MMIQPENLSDHVVRIIRKMILNGSLRPGEKINQAQLAEQLQISRGPVREALRLLQNEGLIKHETNRGTFVTTLSEQDAYEIYTLRALLEEKAAFLAMDHLTDRDFAQLESLLEEFQSAHENQDLEIQAQCDIRFHRIIVEASQHQRLIRMHQQLDTQVGAMFLTVANILPVRASQVVDNHRKLLVALTSSDRKGASKEFSNHYVQALQELANGKKIFNK